MAQITDKLVKVDLIADVAEDYTKELKKKVDVEEGKGLYPDTDKEKLAGIEANAQKNNITKVQVNGTNQTISDDGTLNLDVEQVLGTDGFVKDEDLTPYLKSSDAESTYVKEEGFDEKVKTSVGSVYRPKGSKENLEAIKAVETPTEGDVYNATDTGANYVYVGEGQGDDESGWDKLSETVDLSAYMQTATANEKFAEKTTVEALQSTVTGLDGALKEEDLQFATSEDVLVAIQAGKAKVTG